MGHMAVLGWWGGRGASLAPSSREAFLYLLVRCTSQKATENGREHGQACALPTGLAVWEQGLAACWGTLGRGQEGLSRTICLSSLSSLEDPFTCLLVALSLPPLQCITVSHHMHVTLSSSSCLSLCLQSMPITWSSSGPLCCLYGMPIRLPHPMAIALSPSYAHHAASALPITSPHSPSPMQMATLNHPC